MRLRQWTFSIALLGAAALLAPSICSGQTRDKGPWWPHPIWGADDRAGASNWITPEKIIEAVSLVNTGKVYEMGHVYEKGMFLNNGARTYSMVLVPGTASEETGWVYNEEFLGASIGQVGTQFDGLGHVGERMTMEDGAITNVYYNGVTSEEMMAKYGLLDLGVEKIKPFITRGILIDVAGYKGLDILPLGYEVKLSDVRGALAQQGLSEDQIRPGDALFFHLGTWRLWSEPERIVEGWRQRPGIGPEVASWIIDRKASLVGSDWATDMAGTAVAHHELTRKNGIPNLEFMTFEALLEDSVYEFLFVFTPLRLKGATGSPARPLAIR
jgi:kynurenine formamidase